MLAKIGISTYPLVFREGILPTQKKKKCSDSAPHATDCTSHDVYVRFMADRSPLLTAGGSTLSLVSLAVVRKLSALPLCRPSHSAAPDNSICMLACFVTLARFTSGPQGGGNRIVAQRVRWTPSTTVRRVSQLAKRNVPQRKAHHPLDCLWTEPRGRLMVTRSSQSRIVRAFSPSAGGHDDVLNRKKSSGFRAGTACREVHSRTRTNRRFASTCGGEKDCQDPTARSSSTNVPDNDFDPILSDWPPTLTTADVPISPTVAEAQNLVAGWLQQHDVVDPHPSATELIAKAAGFRSPQDMLAKRPASSPVGLNAAEWDTMRELCRQRAAQHVPVQYLVGEWDFHRISLQMRPPTLIPRPETEELVELVLSWLRSEGLAKAKAGDGLTRNGSESEGEGRVAGLRFLDVGSGTGAIGLALLNELPEATCVAIDAQESAVVLSRLNAERTGLQDRYEIIHVDIAGFGRDARCFDDMFDFVVSNPPYIPRKDMAQLPPDVAKHEDALALDGGEDGLDIVRQIVERCPRLLKKSGPRQLWMEVDTTHPEAMKRWLGLAGCDRETGRGEVHECQSQGVTRFEWRVDLSQRPRFVRLTFAEEEIVAAETHG